MEGISREASRWRRLQPDVSPSLGILRPVDATPAQLESAKPAFIWRCVLHYVIGDSESNGGKSLTPSRTEENLCHFSFTFDFTFSLLC
jgi:hypothetical protein